MGLLPGPGARVSAYLSLPTEPGTDPLVERLLAEGHAVVVPRIDGRRLDWVALGPGAELRRGPLGIREPVGDALPADALTGLDVLFLPGLAVDRTGIRLGQGGGYYDGALSSVPRRADGGPLRAICLFDDELQTRDHYYLVQHESAEHRPEIQLLIDWVLERFRPDVLSEPAVEYGIGL